MDGGLIRVTPPATPSEDNSMLNEGIITNSDTALVKSEMVRQLRRLGETSPKSWEGATFEALTGNTRDEIDWEVEDNKAGYFLWVKTFDTLVGELVEDGYAIVNEAEGSGEKTIRLGEVADDGAECSQLVYPSDSE